MSRRTGDHKASFRSAFWTTVGVNVVAFVLPSSVGHAEEGQKARLAVTGSADISLFGQDGYCGSMTSYDKSNTSGVLIDADRRTWFRLKHKQDCVGDFSFVPEAGKAYVLRAGTPSRPCLAEFFRINPGRQPTRELLRIEESRSCLFPWNHESSQEPASAPQGGGSGR